MVAVVRERLEPLRDALGATGDEVYWVDMAELGANPARIIPAWRQFVEEHGDGASPVRGVGEPLWAGRRPAELAECQLHEALLNIAVEPDTPLWLRCPYNEEALEPSVLEQAARSHPALLEAEDERPSATYGGAHHVDALFRAELPAPAGEVEQLEFERRAWRRCAGTCCSRRLRRASTRSARQTWPWRRRSPTACGTAEGGASSARGRRTTL